MTIWSGVGEVIFEFEFLSLENEIKAQVDHTNLINFRGLGKCFG